MEKFHPLPALHKIPMRIILLGYSMYGNWRWMVNGYGGGERMKTLELVTNLPFI